MDEPARYGEVHGFDLNPPVSTHAAGSLGHADVRVARVEEIPWEDRSFDLVTCLDVIEHTPDDVASLRELLRVTRPGGWLVVTVPAYQLLWSSHDVANQHYRRYRRSQLARRGDGRGLGAGRLDLLQHPVVPAGRGRAGARAPAPAAQAPRAARTCS